MKTVDLIQFTEELVIETRVIPAHSYGQIQNYSDTHHTIFLFDESGQYKCVLACRPHYLEDLLQNGKIRHQAEPLGDFTLEGPVPLGTWVRNVLTQQESYILGAVPVQTGDYRAMAIAVSVEVALPPTAPLSPEGTVTSWLGVSPLFLQKLDRPRRALPPEGSWIRVLHSHIVLPGTLGIITYTDSGNISLDCGHCYHDYFLLRDSQYEMCESPPTETLLDQPDPLPQSLVEHLDGSTCLVVDRTELEAKYTVESDADACASVDDMLPIRYQGQVVWCHKQFLRKASSPTPVVIAGLSKQITCSVCLKDLSTTSQAQLSQCGHLYCRECLSKITCCSVCRVLLI